MFPAASDTGENPPPSNHPTILTTDPDHDGTAHLRLHLFSRTDFGNGLMAFANGVTQMLSQVCVPRLNVLARRRLRNDWPRL